MGTNSIKSHLSKGTAVSEIKLLLSHDTEKLNMLVVVEGEDDVKLLNKFCEKGVRIIESYSGKLGVEEILDFEKLDDFRVIGITDRDYSYNTSHKRMFYYDKCCQESMIFNFNSVINSLCSEYYEGDMNPLELKKHIMSELYFISSLRYSNYINSLGIKFNGISIHNIISNELGLDENNLLTNLSKINSNRDLTDVDMMIVESDYNNDPLMYINGHDLITFFKELCNKSKPNKKLVKSDRISSSFRIAFQDEHFMQTNLYKDTNNYSNKNGLKLWRV